MTPASEMIGLYLTQSGQVGARVVRYTAPDGRDGYSWIGAWGAGCGSRDSVFSSIYAAIARKRGVKVVISITV